MLIDSTGSDLEHSDWAIYYVSKEITITSWYVDTPQCRYMLFDLEDIVRDFTNTYPGGLIAVVVGIVEAVLVMPLAVILRSDRLAWVGLIAILGAMIAVYIDAQRNPRWMEIRALYRGRDVSLIRTRSRTEFERVRWALIRAMERNRRLEP
jgi:hypothetical protein